VTVAPTPGYDELRRRAERLVPVLRERAARTEALRRLPDETVADFHDAGLFRLFQPARYGGSEAPFRAYIDIGATLAHGCASASWVLNNLVAHNWMLGYWPPEAQDEVWRDDPTTLIGSGFIFPSGRARKAAGGYRLSGRWPFSSGIDPAGWNMLAGFVEGAAESAPEPRFFLVPRDDYAVIDTWHAMGLAGTGSKDVEVKDVFVPEHRTVAASVGKGDPHPGSAVNPGPLYRLPWYPLFSFINAGTILGIAQGAVGQFVAGTRERVATQSRVRLAEIPSLQLRIAEAAALVDAAETLMLKDCEEGMRLAEARRQPAAEDKVRWRRDGAYGAALARRAVDIVFAGAGGGAIGALSPLQRALRDIHAASGHIGVNWDLNATMHGRVALGLSPDFPLL
jgi:3-hydroxy-9,10-secoandrosta-1,3,5(10)-triene-9,17-dione monooxygenase